MDIKSSSITADILNILCDGKVHKMQDIADEIEVSRRTVIRHIQSLSYRYPIQTFCGGRKGGGVILESKYIIHGKILTRTKLDLLNQAFDLLQKSNEDLKNDSEFMELIQYFTLSKINGGNYEEDKILW